MNVTDLAFTDAEFCPAEAVRMGFGAFTGEEGVYDLFGCAAN